MADIVSDRPQIYDFVYAITLAGKPLEAAELALISKISLVLRSGRQKEASTETEASSLTLDVKDPDLYFINNSFFVEETIVTFDVFFGGEKLTDTFTCYISTIDVDFPEEGVPTLTITCMDGSRLMTKLKKKRTWQKKRRSDVAKEIGMTYGFQVVVDDSPEVLDTISQSDLHDFAFLEKMAKDEKDDYVIKVENGTLYYKKEKLDEQPEKLFVWRENPYNLISFNPQLNKEEKNSTVSKSDISDTGKIDSGTADNSTTNRTTQGDPTQSWADFQIESHNAYKPSST